MKQHLETFLSQHQGQADVISITHILDETQYFQARGGKADPYSSSTTEGFYLEIQTNGVKIYGSTPSVHQLSTLFETLKTRAKTIKPHQLIDFSNQTSPQTSGHYESPLTSAKNFQLSPGAIQDALCEFSHTLLNGGLFFQRSILFSNPS